jgi:hypothetical protein
MDRYITDGDKTPITLLAFESDWRFLSYRPDMTGASHDNRRSGTASPASDNGTATLANASTPGMKFLLDYTKELLIKAGFEGDKTTQLISQFETQVPKDLKIFFCISKEGQSLLQGLADAQKMAKEKQSPVAYIHPKCFAIARPGNVENAIVVLARR